MRYATIVMLDTSELPEDIVGEIRCNLEFDHKTTIVAVHVFTEDGEEVAKYEKERELNIGPKLF